MIQYEYVYHYTPIVYIFTYDLGGTVYIQNSFTHEYQLHGK